MLTLWRRRKKCQQQVLLDADNLMTLPGDCAYTEALARARQENDAGGDPSHWPAGRREIASMVGKHIGLDTAKRYFGHSCRPERL